MSFEDDSRPNAFGFKGFWRMMKRSRGRRSRWWTVEELFMKSSRWWTRKGFMKILEVQRTIEIVWSLRNFEGRKTICVQYCVCLWNSRAFMKIYYAFKQRCLLECVICCGYSPKLQHLIVYLLRSTHNHSIW